MRWFPKGYGGDRRSPAQLKRDGWHDQNILVVSADDQRLTWPERSRRARGPADAPPSSCPRRNQQDGGDAQVAALA
jgi:hypothetical protein